MSRPKMLAQACLVALLLISACAPAAPPNPTTPPQPAAATAPKATAKPLAKSTEQAAGKTAQKPVARPTERPATKAESQPVTKTAAGEQAIADFYNGKTIRIVVGHSAGGGYDTYSRLVARHMGKYLPGNPNVIVENMTGAAGMVALNHVYNVAPKDGTVISHSIGSSALEQIFGNQSVQFDMSKMQYLGAPAGDSYVFIVHRRAGVTEMEEILGPNAKEVVIGSDAPGNTSYNGMVLVRDVLGANIKLVQGYAGSSKIRLAIDNSEVDGFLNGWDSTVVTSSEQLQSGEWLVLMRFTEEPIRGGPDVPGVLSFASTDEQRQLLRFGIILPSRFSRPYALAPEVPAERVQALQSALARTFEDQELLAEAEKAKLPIEPLSGDELRQHIVEFLGMPDGIKNRLQEVLQAPPS